MQLFVDNLTNLDFSYLHPRRGLIGETWLASVVLEGALDDQGMVCDFGIVKKMIREWLDDQIDHRLLVPTGSENLSIHHSDERSELTWRFNTRSELDSQCPTNSLALVETQEITAETVASWCIEQLMPLFPESVHRLQLEFLPEKIDGPYYHYSHGLKKHAGNCQRIAHGHRSKIEIWRNGELSLTDMQLWAERWRDIYIGSEEDVDEHAHGRVHFAYRAQQGRYSLTLPEEHVYLVDTDSTVELIASHIATQLAQENPGDEFRVKAYEGLAKGAIATDRV